MDCERAQDHFSDFLDGSIEDSRRSLVNAHLQECGRCLAELEGLKETRLHLHNLPLRKAPPELLAAVRQGMGRESSGTALWKKLFLPAHIKIPLEAAAAILLFFLVYGAQKGEPPKGNPPLQAPRVESRPAPVAGKTQAPSAEERVTAARKTAPPSLPTVPARRVSTGGGRIEPSPEERMPEEVAFPRMYAAPPSRLPPPLPHGREVVLEVAPENRTGLEERIADVALRLGGRVDGESTRQGVSLKSGPVTDALRVRLPADSSELFLAELSKMGTLPPEGLPGSTDLPAGPTPDVVAYSVRIRVR